MSTTLPAHTWDAWVRRTDFPPDVDGGFVKKAFFDAYRLGQEAERQRSELGASDAVEPGDVLDRAKNLVQGDRQKIYGSPEDSMRAIGQVWGALLDREPLTPADVALLLAAMKLARLAKTPSHLDSWIDLAGYAAIGGQVGSIAGGGA